MKPTAFFTFSVVATVLQSDIILGKNDLLLEEDARLDFMGLATKYGHPAVRHQVTTEDGYILTLFHIPGRSKLPVLLMHGLLDTADTFLLRGNDSLGIALANSGYDLWFGNCRGNRYSRRHRDLDPNRDSSYWSFTFHEMGYYDLPAIIDRVLNETGTPSLTAIGHSRGNTIFFVLGSTRPEYNSKVNEFFGYDSVSTMFLRTFCPQNFISYQFCLNQILYPILGFDPFTFDQSFLRIFLYHYPAGTSWRDSLHFTQLSNSRIFRRYDFGNDINMLMYNSTSPPLYSLGRVTMPVALIGARNDPISTLSNVDLLKRQLPNVADYAVVPWLLFSHGQGFPQLVLLYYCVSSCRLLPLIRTSTRPVIKFFRRKKIKKSVENENTIYPVAEYDDLGRAGEDPRKSLMENMMEYTERLTDAEDRRPSPKVEAKYPSWSELAGLKDVGIKKWVTALSNNVSSKLLPKNRRQLKWRKGTTVVCYLKLCSFKQPF
ncbi:hypothetical protein KGM_201191 [Danaus plexippus plexippus]|uniref:Partial AB-hydrolase lipase domain-containing protein n=1 Tax=Danaus plexippus plexippus TaxID=278856 RepID=A0A212FGM6_DANPL|nr:hypothetical protein KGM_201191 [Danaus plexippus plexippus]